MPAQILAPKAEIHLWRAPLDSPTWPAADRLPSKERERATRLRAASKRRRRVMARWALRNVLAHYLEREPAEIELAAGARGKPTLADRSAGLHFNLSHSGPLALVAVSRNREVGVDLELIDPTRDAVALARRALPPVEAVTVQQAPAESQAALFHAAWTRREAVAKCFGGGLCGPPPEGPVSVANIDVGAGFAAAVAVAGDALPQVRRLVIDPVVATPPLSRA